jgi:exodeoxyribonuclease V beta subunit
MEPNMTSFNVLDRQVQVRGDHFLEASAGTGKTFAIEHLVARLILEGEDPLTLDQILVVTFTRAATRELKSRIRTTLETILQRTDIDYVKAVLESRETTAKRRIDSALACFDEARIFTIHGFCHRMLAEFAFEANVPLELSDPDASNMRVSMLKVVEDVYRTELKYPAYSSRQLHALLGKHQHDVAKLSARVVSAMSATSAGAPDFGESLEAFRMFLNTHPPLSLQHFEPLFGSYKKMTLPEFSGQAEHLERLLEKKCCSAEEFEELFKHKEFFLEKMVPHNLKVRAQPKNTEELDRLREALMPILQDARDPQKTFSRLVRDCWKRWEKRPELAPDEMLQKMEKCLDEPAFIQRVRQNIRAVIVDEFQDTDPVQWKIFQRLFLGHTAALYLVGDPKQSIYAFRSADVYTYLKAKEMIGSEGQGVLDTNYRSDPALVALLNRLFQRAGEWMPLPALKQTLAVNPVNARLDAEEKDFGDDKKPVHFFVLDGKDEESFFSFIVEEIQKFSPSDCAVLVKDRYQASRLQEFLKRWGISSVVKRPGSLRDSPAWPVMQDLLRAVEDPEDLSHIKQVLGGPLIGWSLEELRGGLEREELQMAKARFCAFREILQERGFAVFYRTFLSSGWGQKAGLDRQLQQLAELLVQEPDVFELDPEDERLQIRPEGDEEAVAILTVHMSKGLEFEVVFALGVAASSPAEGEEFEAEKMRQLYVALTRAKRRVYIPLLLNGDGDAPIEAFFQKLGEPLSILEELDISYTLLDQHVFHLEKAKRKEPPLLPPPKEPVIAGAPQFLLSFTALSQKTHAENPIEVGENILPPGAETGTILHKILEKLFTTKQDVKKLILREIEGTHLEGWHTAIEEMIQKVLQLSLKDFTLSDLSPRKLQAEMEFLFPTEGGMVKGFIDLFFEKEGLYYLLDWKSNLLSDYGPSHLEQAMRENDYFLQGEIYSQALRRYLRLFDSRSFEECFGGVFYVFLRGPAVYYFRPTLCGNPMS